MPNCCGDESSQAEAKGYDCGKAQYRNRAKQTSGGGCNMKLRHFGHSLGT